MPVWPAHLLLSFWLGLSQPLLAGEKLPTWVKQGRSVRFPESRYYQAVGRAVRTNRPDEDWQRAEAAAMNAIARELQVKIASEFVMFKFESDKDGIFREQTSQEITASTEIVLAGMRIEDEVYDKRKKVYYALAVLDRRKATRAMFEEMSVLKQGARGALGSARWSVEANDPIQALFHLLRAFDLLQALQERQQLVVVLKPESLDLPSLPAEPDVGQVLQMAHEIAGQIRIEAMPPSTIIQSRQALPVIIQVRSFFDTKPLKKLAMACYFQQGQGRAEFLGRTDETGQSTLVLQELGVAPHGRYRIQVKADVSDLLTSPNNTNQQRWNKAISRALPGTSLTLKRLDLELEDYCAGVVADLMTHIIPQEEQPFQLALGNITYAETGASSPLVAYIKDRLTAELARSSQVQVLSPEKFEQGMRAARGRYRGKKRPDRPEVLAELLDVDGMLVGSYWDRAEGLQFNLQVVQRGSEAILSTATMNVPKHLLPSELPYLPPNFSTFAQTQQLGNLKQPKSGLDVEVWVDRGAGAIYRAGEKLTVFVRATRDSYLYLIYHDAAGNDILIYPNASQTNNLILGGVIYQIPDARDTFDFKVQAPFGSELLKAVVSKEPFPELPGRTLSNGLKLLKGSYRENVTKLRRLNVPGGYAEGTCVVTTVK